MSLLAANYLIRELPVPLTDGNAVQVRAVAEQVAEAVTQRSHLFSEEFARLETHIDTRIAAAVTVSEHKLKLWVIGGVITQLIPMLPIIFFLGGIYNTNSAAITMLQKQQTQLEQRGQWMNERERWEQSIEQWAEPKGYVPPRSRETAP